jgi:hypothetical protein
MLLFYFPAEHDTVSEMKPSKSRRLFPTFMNSDYLRSWLERIYFKLEMSPTSKPVE